MCKYYYHFDTHIIEVPANDTYGWRFYNLKQGYSKGWQTTLVELGVLNQIAYRVTAGSKETSRLELTLIYPDLM